MIRCRHLPLVLLQLSGFVSAVTYDYPNVPGYTNIPPCASNALTLGVEADYNNCQRNSPATVYFSCLCGRDSTVVESKITSVFRGETDIYTECGTSELSSATSVWHNLCEQNGKAAATGIASSSKFCCG